MANTTTPEEVRLILSHYFPAVTFTEFEMRQVARTLNARLSSPATQTEMLRPRRIKAKDIERRKD